MTISESPQHSLVELHARPRLPRYLNQIWERREFASRVAMRDLRAKNMNNALGLIWFMLNPALSISVYFIFFGLILGTDRGVDNFITFLAIGIFTYQFLQRALTSSSRTVATNVGIIRAIRFPRALLPISDVLGQTMSQIPVVAVVFIVAIATGETPSIKWLLILPLTLVQAVFALGLGLILARMTTTFRDLTSFLPYAFRLAFYASGVIFSVEAFVQDPLFRALFSLNPFYCHIGIARWALLDIPVSGWSVAGAALWTFFALPVGVVYFWRGEPYGKA
jgi:teichoic acid transport system permease protein